MICTLCRSDKHATVLSGSGFDDPTESFDLVRCEECHLVSVSPLLPPERLGQYYSASYYGGGSGAKFSQPAERLVHLLNRVRARGLQEVLGVHEPQSTRILDVGCGRGVFLKHLHARGYDCTGLDIPSFPASPSRPGLRFVQGTLDEAPLEPASLDAVSIWHVLEHTSDPVRTLRRIAELLRPGGVVAIAVPNYGSLQSALFGRHWFHLDLPRHLYHLDRDVLTRILRDTGFEILSTSTSSLDSIDQSLFGFVQSALNATFSSRPNRFYSLLKQQVVGTASAGFDILQFALGAALLPLSLVEKAVAGWLGRGAVVVVYARRRHASAR